MFAGDEDVGPINPYTGQFTAQNQGNFSFSFSLILRNQFNGSDQIGYFPGRYHYAVAATVSQRFFSHIYFSLSTATRSNWARKVRKMDEESVLGCPVCPVLVDSNIISFEGSGMILG